jgi:hypothetical protein
MAITADELIAAIKDLSTSDQKRVKSAFGTTTVDPATLEKNKELMQQTLEIQQKALDAQQESAKIFNDENALIQARKESFETYLRLKGLEANEVEKILNGEQASVAAAAERLGIEEGILREKQEQYKQDQLALINQEKFGRQSSRYAKELGGFLGVNVRLQDTFLGKTIDISNKLKENSGYQSQFLRDLRETFSVQNLALSTLTKIGEVTVAFVKAADQARAALAASTGLGYEFTGVMVDAQREANLFGVTMDSAGRAISSLVSGTTDFINLSGSQQRALTITNSKLERLGVTTDEGAKLFQNMTQALGMSAMGANDLAIQMAIMGNQLGISTGQMIRDFNQSLSVLSVYGDRAPQIFSKLAAAAKAAGVEVSTLLTLAGKFDTFDSAAQSVAQLNAVLGTQLSTTQMLLATEEERIETLIESVQMGDMQFDQLDRFTQKAVAASVGITDMAEANKIFGMSLEEYQRYSKQMENSADAQAKLDAAVSKTVPVFDKFKILIAELALAVEPTLEILGDLATSVTNFLKDMDTDTKQMIVGFAAMASGLIVLGTALAPIITMFSTLGIMMKVSGGLAGILGLGGAGIGALLPVLGIVAAIGAGGIAMSKMLSASPTTSAMTNRATSINTGTGRSAMGGTSAAVKNYVDVKLESVLVEIDGAQYRGRVKSIVNKEMAGVTTA